MVSFAENGKVKRNFKKMFTKSVTKFYIVDVDTYMRKLQGKSPTEVSDYLDKKKAYDSLKEAEDVFYKNMQNSKKDWGHTTVIEITRTIKDYSKLYAILAGACLLISGLVGAWYLLK